VFYTLGSTISGQLDWVGQVFSCSTGGKAVSIGLVEQIFQPSSNQVETVEKAFA